MQSSARTIWLAFPRLRIVALAAALLCLASAAATAQEQAPADSSNYEGHIALAQEPVSELDWGQVWRRYHLTIVAVVALIVVLAGSSLALLASNRRQRRLKHRARRLSRRLSELSENVPGALYQFRLRPDGSSHFPYASSGIERIYGLRPEDVFDDAQRLFDRVHPDDLPAVREAIERSAETMAPWHQLFRINHPQQGLRWVSGSATPSRRSDGSVTWHGYIRDVTEFHNAVERVRTAASVFEASKEGICITDEELKLSDVNRAFEEMTGYVREDLAGHLPRVLLPPDRAEAKAMEIRAALAAQGQWKGEVPIQRKSGETFPVEVSISPVLDDEGQPTHYVALVSDITLRKMHEQELDEIARLDALTGIGNRRQVVAQLDRAVSLTRSSGARFAICMMDLDDFKPVNDRHGHDVGDKLLTAIAQRLKTLVRAGDFVGRLGGDEFVLILHDPHGDTVFDRILEEVRRPVQIDHIIVRVSASLGVTFCDGDHAPDAAELLREADQAVYRSKAAGRDRYSFERRSDPGSHSAAGSGAA